MSTNDWAGASDEALVAGLAARDEHAVEVLLSRHWASAWRVALQLTGDAASAEDVAQEALVRVLQAAARFAPGAAFRPWFFTIVRNAARDLVKREQRRVVHEAGAPAREARRAESEDGVVKDEVAGVVRAELERLKPEQREVLSLHYVAGLTLQEIASVLGCPFGTVSSRLGRGLTALKKALPAGVAVGAGVITSALGGASAAPSATTLLARASATGAGASSATAPRQAGTPARTATKLGLPALLVAATVGVSSIALGILLGAPDPAAPPGAVAPGPIAGGPAPSGPTVDEPNTTSRSPDAPTGDGAPLVLANGADVDDTDDGDMAGQDGEEDDEGERIVARGRLTFRGVPWAGARVDVGEWATHTDVDGRFEVENVDRDDSMYVTLEARRNADFLLDPGHELLGRAEPVLRGPGATTNDDDDDDDDEPPAPDLASGVELEMLPITFSGRVLTVVDEAPIEGARVFAIGGEVRTDAEGRFELTAARVVRGRLVALHPDFAPAVWELDDEETGEIVLRLERGLTVDVQVLRSDGQPAVGAQVNSWDHLLDARGDRDTRQRFAVTDGQGRVRLDGLHPAMTLRIGRATVRLRVCHEGAPPFDGDFEVDGREPIVVRLATEHEVRGRVMRSDGGPAAGAVVVPLPRGAGSRRFHEDAGALLDSIRSIHGALEADEEGRFALTLPRGTERLLVHADGFADRLVTIDVPAGDLTIGLVAGGGTITGHVTGEQVSGMMVYAFLSGERAVPVAAAVLAADARFALGGLEPDSLYDLELRAKHADDAITEVPGVRVGSAVLITGPLPPAEPAAPPERMIVLTALAADTGETIDAAWFLPVGGTGLIAPDSHGTYVLRFEDVGAGVHVGAPGRRPVVVRTFDPAHEPTRRAKRYTVTLQGGAGRAEVAVDAGDLTPERALVAWRDPGTGETFRLPLAARGGRLRATLDGVTPGVCEVRVEIWQAGEEAPRAATTVVQVREGQTAPVDLTVR